MNKNRTAITPTREENYPEWYQQVIRAADLAENADSVRGCMVIKPWGNSLWENIKTALDGEFKKRGVKNYYFPLLIPVKHLAREAEHVEGFAKECAVVTHHRLEADGEGGLKPAGELAEPYVIRPTSETIIGEAASKWINSYRDLPLLTNQWCNVMRWEMRTRLFLRTSEFLWQEGHTVHATEEEAREMVYEMSGVYRDFMKNYLAMPVYEGAKVAIERFPGAEDTIAVEAMMQDGKALQAGTSHYLGQNFAKAMNIKFLDKDNQEKYGYTTSWGVSTRMIGGLVMHHSDDDGLVLPPRIAPTHVVIIPILHNDEEADAVLNYCQQVAESIGQNSYGGRQAEVEIDKRDIKSSEKVWDWIKKGAPIRLEIGPRDLANDAVFVARRDKGPKDKQSMKKMDFVQQLPQILDEMQQGLLDKAKERLQTNTKEVASKDDLYAYFKSDKAGFAKAFIDPDTTEWDKLKADLSVTPRCMPFEWEDERGTCILTGKKDVPAIVVSRAY